MSYRACLSKAEKLAGALLDEIFRGDRRDADRSVRATPSSFFGRAVPETLHRYQSSPCRGRKYFRLSCSATR